MSSSNLAFDPAYAREIGRFLNELAHMQQSMIELLSQKLKALIARNLKLVSELNREERRLQQRLRQLIDHRQHLLNNLHRQGLEGETLFAVCRKQDWLKTDSLRQQFQVVQKSSEQLRQQTWAIWAMTHRAAMFYGEAIDVIANVPDRDLIYEQNSQSRHLEAGGSLLDASA